jgi:hypothetical protein
MYAYSMAAAHTNLPHVTMLNYMVSNVDMDEEGWKYIDALEDDVCEEPVNGVFYPGKPLPTVLHFCQFYRSAEIGFQKRRMRKAILECDKPLLTALPKSQGKNRYKNRDGEVSSYLFAFTVAFFSCSIGVSFLDYENGTESISKKCLYVMYITSCFKFDGEVL